MQLGLEILDWIYAHLHHPWLDQAMIFFSLLGGGGAVWIALAALLLLRRSTRRAGAYIALGLLFSLLFCNLGLKPLLMRARPFSVSDMQLLVPEPGSFSFPSGHTSAAFAAAPGIAGLGRGYALAAYSLAALISFSRLYLYLHYPGDVLAGLALGLFCAWLARLMVNRLWPDKGRD